jgi:hypothetical protein
MISFPITSERILAESALIREICCVTQNNADFKPSTGNLLKGKVETFNLPDSSISYTTDEEFVAQVRIGQQVHAAKLYEYNLLFECDVILTSASNQQVHIDGVYVFLTSASFGNEMFAKFSIWSQQKVSLYY